MTDVLIRSVLLLAGNGLLMIACRIRLVPLRLRALSTLRLARLNGVLAFLVRACPFLAFRSSVGLSVLFVGAHIHSPNLPAVAAYLLRFGVHTFRNSLRIRDISIRERVLILGGAVANPLFRAVAICWAELRIS